MTKDDAKEIPAEIWRGERPLYRTKHIWTRVEGRGYSVLDVYTVLSNSSMEGGPKYNTEYRNHVVRVRGKSGDGQDTRIAISLYRVGPCWLLSIMPVKPVARRKKRGKGTKRGKR